MYSESISIVSTSNLFEPVDDAYLVQLNELHERIWDNERINYNNEHYHPTVVAWTLVVLLKEFGGLLAARPMELLCNVRPDALSFRAVLAYHRTNPIVLWHHFL